jgi:hypothetical protein
LPAPPNGLQVTVGGVAADGAGTQRVAAGSALEIV